ncbi:glycosyl transferase family 2 [Sporocytophaga myxococcoides]|uniref:Glycosyl transferase family 2 n=1 Tax=Sporocytophaga myxococcoides TaxID=153721 RepID=A0A098LCS4_9BACT|nr:glycosyltransferase family 2 protein [Sporocytophaga myxococcoides]GAL84048.1 glycosyl transferase family 2 [Sporocytophaga myxococcoides]
MKVSIIIPSYNRASYIIDTLQSVANQTSADWECIVVDDGSTDHTEEVVNEFMSRYPQMPFKWMKNARTKGAQGARNTGFLNSQGEYLIFLDSDDLLDKHCVENRLGIIKIHPLFDYYAFPVRLFTITPGDLEYAWNRMNKAGWSVLDRMLVHDAPWQTLGCFWSRKALEEIGMWDERVTSLQDWDAHIQLVMHPGLKGWICSDEKSFDAFYRVGSHDSISKKFSTKKGAETNVYLIEKAYKSLQNYGLLEKHLPAFRQFLWIMNTLISISDNEMGKVVAQKYHHIYEMVGVKSFAHRLYAATRFDMSKPKIIRGIVSIIPQLFPINNWKQREDTCSKIKINDL